MSRHTGDADPDFRVWLLVALLVVTLGAVGVEALTGSLTWGIIVGVLGILLLLFSAAAMGTGRRLRRIRGLVAAVGLMMGTIVLLASGGDIYLRYLGHQTSAVVVKAWVSGHSKAGEPNYSAVLCYPDGTSQQLDAASDWGIGETLQVFRPVFGAVQPRTADQVDGAAAGGAFGGGLILIGLLMLDWRSPSRRAQGRTSTLR